MKKSMSPPPRRKPIETESQSNAALKTVVLYEDAESGKAAVQLLHRVAQNLTDDAALYPAMWKFDHLTLPQLEQLAASDAAAAHLLVIAGQDQFPLPEAIQILIDRWLQRDDDQDRAIAALLFHDSTGTPARGVVQSYLLNLASKTNIRFFIHSQARESRPAPSTSPSLFNPWVEQASSSKSESPSSRWGLNE